MFFFSVNLEPAYQRLLSGWSCLVDSRSSNSNGALCVFLVYLLARYHKELYSFQRAVFVFRILCKIFRTCSWLSIFPPFIRNMLFLSKQVHKVPVLPVYPHNLFMVYNFIPAICAFVLVDVVFCHCFIINYTIHFYPCFALLTGFAQFCLFHFPFFFSSSCAISPSGLYRHTGHTCWSLILVTVLNAVYSLHQLQGTYPSLLSFISHLRQTLSPFSIVPKLQFGHLVIFHRTFPCNHSAKSS
jgi:hypothetical protein